VDVTRRGIIIATVSGEIGVPDIRPSALVALKGLVVVVVLVPVLLAVLAIIEAAVLVVVVVTIALLRHVKIGIQSLGVYGAVTI
jgi:hypothetical protein